MCQKHIHHIRQQGRSQDFSFYRGEGNFEVLRPPGPRAGVGFTGLPHPRSLPRPHQLEGLGDWGSAVRSPSGFQDGALAAKQFSRVLSVQSGISRQFSVVYCPSFHSSNFCQGKSSEKQPRRLPRLP